jgi:hypothetical protein
MLSEKELRARSNASINRVGNINDQDIQDLRLIMNDNNTHERRRDYWYEPEKPYEIDAQIVEPDEVNGQFIESANNAELIEATPTVINDDRVMPLLYKSKDTKKRFMPTFISNSTKRMIGKNIFNKPRWGMTTQQSRALPSELHNEDIRYGYNIGGITRKSKRRKSKQTKRRKSKQTKRRKSKKSKRRN